MNKQKYYLDKGKVVSEQLQFVAVLERLKKLSETSHNVNQKHGDIK